MKFAHGETNPTTPPALAIIVDDRAVFLRDLLQDAPKDLQQLLELPQAAQEHLLAQLSTVNATHPAAISLTNFHHSSAVLRPPAVLAVGLNYSEHASELSLDTNAEPVLFSLFPNSLTGHGRTITLPTRLSEEVDYEGELGVIIGRAAKNVPVEQALEHVFGYTVVNDITARNLQFQEPQWCRCKSFDGFTPTGPVVVTANEITDPQQLWIRTVVDGVTVQDAPTTQMIRSVAQLIAALSAETTLLPGTLISTGSPGGAGRSRKPPLYLSDGTTVTVSISNIGELTNHCVAGSR